MQSKIFNLQESYDRVAEEYASRLYKELEKKPLDQQLLDRFAENVKDLGAVCDMGCGPGLITRYLSDHGVDDVFGIDLSPEMVGLARCLNPDIAFRQGDMLSLEKEDNSWGGIAAFYSIIHIPREQVVNALGELKRVLKPGGLLLLSFHIGDEHMHIDELWGEEVSIDFFLFTPPEMESYLDLAGLELGETVVRPPYAEDVEYQSQRAYIFARKP